VEKIGFITLPNGNQMPVSLDALGSDFLEKNSKLIGPEKSVEVNPLDVEIDLEKKKLGKKGIFNQAKSAADGLDQFEKRATEIVLERRQKEQQKEKEKADKNQMTQRAKLNELLEINDSRDKLGLGPKPIPTELQAVTENQGGQSGGENLDASQFVGAPQTAPVNPRISNAMQTFNTLDRARDLGAAGIIQKTEAEAGSAQSLARLADESRAQLMDIEKERQFRQEERIKRVEKQEVAYDNIAQELSDFEFDPTGGFSSKSALNKVLTAVAVGLGGVSASYLGGPNMALQIVENKINRDVQAQRDRFNKLGQKSKMQDGAYSRMLETFDTQDEAAMALNAALLQSTAFRIEAITKNALSEAVRGEGNVLMQELIQKSEIIKAELGEKLLKGPQINISKETRQRVTSLRASDSTLDEVMADFEKLNAATGLFGRIPGADADAFNASTQRRMARIIRSLIPDEGRAEKLMRELTAREGMNARTFKTTFENRVSNLRRDIENELQVELKTAGQVGEDVGVFDEALEGDISFEEFR